MTSSSSLLLIYRPRKDERLSWSSWLTYSGRFTHISGHPAHPSAVGRTQDSESSPVKDQRSTAAPRNQHRPSKTLSDSCDINSTKLYAVSKIKTEDLPSSYPLFSPSPFSPLHLNRFCCTTICIEQPCLCRHAVSVCPSVRLSRSCIVSKQVNMSSDFRSFII